MPGSLLFSGSFYLTLLFGYLYLWAVTPGWPPERFIDSGWLLPAATALASILSALAVNAAVRRNVDGRGARLALLSAALVALLAAAGCAIQVLGDLPAPTSHAYAAVTAVVLGYSGLHALLSALFALYAWLRCRAGFVSAARSQDLRVVRLWSVYTAGTTAISMALVHGLPVLLASAS